MIETEQGVRFTHKSKPYPPKLEAVVEGKVISLIQSDVIGFQNLFAKYRIGEKMNG